MALKVKEGVEFKEFNESRLYLMDELRTTSEMIGKDIVITCADEGFEGDGVHRDGSFHYKFLALDVRRWNLTKNDIEEIEDMITLMNEAKTMEFVYDFVLESDHIHIEYDTNKENL